MKNGANSAKLALFAVSAFALALLLLSAWNRNVVNEARRILQKQGIKTRLLQFDFSVPADFQKRGQAVLRADVQLDQILAADLRALQPYNSNSAVVIWKERPGQSGADENAWSAVRQTLDEHRSELDAARKAILEGPIGFAIDWTNGYALLIPHIGVLPHAAQTLGVATLADLHDGRFDEAWTNLLATTRTLTAWRAEPTAWDQNARFRLMEMLFAVNWQALQSNWSDEQLAILENEWRTSSFFEPLPQMIEYDGACVADTVQRMLYEPTDAPYTLREVIESPKLIPVFVDDRLRSFLFRWRGSYDDQSDALFYFRDRRVEVSRALEKQTFAEMLPMPGMTNAPSFKSRHRSWTPSLVNLERFSIQTKQSIFVTLGSIGRAAESEIRRRILLTVLALERHRLRQGQYPQSLDEIDVPNNASIDFVDGKPLRYQRTKDGHFFLYSIGLDCVDDGGVTPEPPPPRMPLNYELSHSTKETSVGLPIGRQPLNHGIQPGQDLIWPLPKTEF
jgi:hypothetical protein